MTVELLKANIRVRGRLSLQDMNILRNNQILESQKTLNDIGIVGGEWLIVIHGERPALRTLSRTRVPSPKLDCESVAHSTGSATGAIWMEGHGNCRPQKPTSPRPNRCTSAEKLAFPLVTFLARDGEAGYVYQVKGEVEAMRYQPSSGPVNIVSSHSFHTLYHIAELTESQAAMVKEVSLRSWNTRFGPKPPSCDRKLSELGYQGGFEACKAGNCKREAWDGQATPGPDRKAVI